MTSLLIIGTTLLTGFISGVIGMAGGMILMAVLGLLLPVASAMIVHGVTQAGANGYRAYLLRKHIRWSVLPYYLAGSFIGISIFSLIQFIPSKNLIFISIGTFCLISLLLPKTIHFDILSQKYAVLCGTLVTAAQILAGASGPILDVFYIRSSMNRYEIIATKGITQTIGHLIKITYYIYMVRIVRPQSLEVQELFLLLCVFMTLIGTNLGKIVLDKISDSHFRKLSRVVIAIIGIFCIYKGLT